MKLVSIVFSFRNEEKNLKELISRVDATFKKIENYKYELIFVNDDSNDDSEKILEELQESHKIKIINMSRTFGVGPCVLAGFKYSSGDCIVYLDSDFMTVKKIILKLWDSKLKNVGDIELDPKTALQQWLQSKGGGLPDYTDLKREGLDHDPIFHVEVKLQNGLTSIGKAKSKREAQQNAAQKLLSLIRNNND